MRDITDGRERVVGGELIGWVIKKHDVVIQVQGPLMRTTQRELLSVCHLSSSYRKLTTTI